uniref:Serpentine Receptor, class BC (Class B-like) n=1 Tax=Panagrolaimus sp. JU765 TaxID=591449 RepID=A0AC34PZE8_9BILA
MGQVYYLLEVALGTVFDFIAFWTFIFLFFKYIIFKKYTVIEISPAMKFYMSTEIITTFLVFFDLLFYTVFWNPIDVYYNGWANFILGGTQVLAIAAKPVTVFFLGVDRVLCITFPFKNLKFQKYIPVFGEIIFIIIIDIIVFLKLVMNSIPEGDETECGSFACRVPITAGNYYTTVRFLNGGANIVMSISLAILIKIKLHSTNTNHKEGSQSKTKVQR